MRNAGILLLVLAIVPALIFVMSFVAATAPGSTGAANVSALGIAVIMALAGAALLMLAKQRRT